jgi:acyl-CoA-binding protein
MLDLYSLNKQAEIGEINIDPPKMFDFVAQAKYNAWKSRAGMSKDEAMTKYIELVNSLLK